MNNSSSIDSPEEDYLYIDVSQLPNAGNGLYTAIPIYNDEIISLFKGEILTNASAKERKLLGRDKYFINLLNGKILDSREVFCFAKYANDVNGGEQSAFVNNAIITLDDNQVVCLKALKNIKVGSEIFCSYGKQYWLLHS